MSDMQPKWTGWTIGTGARVGFVIGALIPCVEMFPEFTKRLSWARVGGGGESAAWGEPLFYMLMLGLPAGLVGAMAGVLLIVIIRWIIKYRWSSL